MTLYVGNLSPDTRKEDLQKAFEIYGVVTRINVIADRETGKPRGFAFVEMSSADDGIKAIAGLHEQELHGHTITVAEARKKGESSAT